MHGAGELMMKNGQMIQGTWDKGLKVGNGVRINEKGKRTNVIFYQDMEFNENDQNPDCWNIPFTVFLTSVVVVLVTLYAIGVSNYVLLIIAIFVYIVMLGEGMGCKTNRFLSNMTKGEDIFAEINHGKEGIPKIHFSVQNYHYETKVVRKSGKNHVRREKKITHVAGEDYRFFEWFDCSPDSSAINYIRGQKLVRLDF